MKNYGRTLWLTSGCLLAMTSLCLPLFATQAFWFGFFFQAVPVTAVSWGLSALGVCWLLWTYNKYPLFTNYAFKFPIVWSVLLLSLISLALSFTHTAILQTWFGSPQLTEGVISFFVQAVIAAIFIILLKIPKIKRKLVAFAILAGLTFSVMTYIGCPGSNPTPGLLHWKWSPYYFPDYLAFIALSFIACYILAINRFYKLLVVLSIFAVNHMAVNLSLTYGLYIAIATVLAARLLFRSRKLFHKLLPLMCLGITVSFIIIISSLHLIPNMEINSTLLVRGILTRLSVININNWQELLFGLGWGNYGEFVSKNLFTIKELALYSNGKLSLNNEALTRDFFHSHNLLLEWLCSLGLIGFTALCASIYYIIKSFKQKYIYLAGLFLIAYLLVSSFWFQLPATLPYSILAFVIFSRPYPIKLLHPLKLNALKLNVRLPLLFRKKLTPRKLIYPAGTAIVTLLITANIFYCYTTVIYSNFNKLTIDNNYGTKINTALKQPIFKFNKLLGDKHLLVITRGLTMQSLNKLANPKFINEQYIISLLTGNIEIAKHLYKNSFNCKKIESCQLALNIVSELATDYYIQASFDANSNLLLLWHHLARDYLAQAPLRTDMLAPYLSYLVINHKYNFAWDLINKILAINTNDPIALWYSGTIKIEDDSLLKSGLADLNKSLNFGISRLISLNNEQIAFIKKNNP